MSHPLADLRSKHVPAMVKAQSTWYLTLVLLTFFSTHPTFGQLDQGAITGTLTDPRGAVVPRANVQLTNIDTNFVIEAQTDGSGVYTFQPVKIGHYSVTVARPGSLLPQRADSNCK
jgi:hypothetical protein